jgi:AcrR family transcriptional regulator
MDAHLDVSSKQAPTVNGYRHGRVPRPVREQQLLDVAEEQFATRGYDSASIEEIARLAGVTRPIVYDHFGDKEGVYLACLRRARGELQEMILVATAAASTPREMLERGTDAYFEFVERSGQRWTVLFGGAGLTGAAADEVARLRFTTVGHIRDLVAGIAPGADAVAIEAFAHAISGSAEQVAKWWRANPHLTRAQVVAQQCAFAWTGLRELLPEPDR